MANLAAPFPYASEEKARLARALGCVAPLIAGALGIPLAEAEGAEEVDTTDATGGVGVDWKSDLTSLFGGAQADEEITLQGVATAFLRSVGSIVDLDALAARAIYDLLVLRARGTLLNAADDVRFDLTGMSIDYPAGQERDCVYLSLPFTITIRLAILARPESATATTSGERVVYPSDFRQGS